MHRSDQPSSGSSALAHALLSISLSYMYRQNRRTECWVLLIAYANKHWQLGQWCYGTRNTDTHRLMAILRKTRLKCDSFCALNLQIKFTRSAEV